MANDLASSTPSAPRFPTEGPIGVGLLGCGTVGTGVVKLLLSHAEDYAHRLGRPLELRKVAVRDLTRVREGLNLNNHLTTDPHAVIKDPATHIVVEVMGGVEPAKTLILEAISAGKHIVTANKEVIARHGSEIYAAAHKHNVGVFIEGSVGGGIPILMPLKASLAANRIRQIAGIINGTTNYILTMMSQHGQGLAEALAEAQALGYAEADPTADVEAYDAAYKIAILASTFFAHRIRIEDVYREGITRLTAADILYARELGYVIKLLGVARREEGHLQVRVHPALIPAAHPLAQISGVMNAIAVQGDAVGEVMFSGPGAGMLPTASAVLGDVLNIAANLERPNPLVTCHHERTGDISPIEALETQFYIRLIAQDVPGVIGTIGQSCGKFGISILSMVQKGEHMGRAEIVLVTHRVKEANLRSALEDLKHQPTIQEIASVIRVEALK